MFKKIICFSLLFVVMMMVGHAQSASCTTPTIAVTGSDETGVTISVTSTYSGDCDYSFGGVIWDHWPSLDYTAPPFYAGEYQFDMHFGPFTEDHSFSFSIPYGTTRYFRAYLNCVSVKVQSEVVSFTAPAPPASISCTTPTITVTGSDEAGVNIDVTSAYSGDGLLGFVYNAIIWSSTPDLDMNLWNYEGSDYVEVNYGTMTTFTNEPYSFSNIPPIPHGETRYFRATMSYQPTLGGEVLFYQSEVVSFTAPPPANQAPIANAGAGQTVHPGTSVSLNGSLSADPDENYPLTYAWTIQQKPAGSTAALDTPDQVSTSINIDLPGEYRVRLVVTDSKGLAGEPAEVTLSTFNTAPVAAAGNDKEVIYLNAPVSLSGSTSWDDDGDTITYSWTLVQIPDGSNATITNPNAVNPSITPDIYGDYTIQLVVSDPWESSTPDEVVVSTKNLPPIADAGNNQSCLQGATVSFNGGASSDPNGDAITYSWEIASKPDGSSAYLTNANSVTASLHTDLAGEYVVALIVNDGLLDSPAATAAAVATSYVDATIQKLNQVIATLNAMPNSAFKNATHKDNLTRKVSSILVLLENGEYHDAYVQLENSVLQKFDGCADNGTPENNDWIKSCTYQNQVYPLVIEALALLDNLF